MRPGPTYVRIKPAGWSGIPEGAKPVRDDDGRVLGYIRFRPAPVAGQMVSPGFDVWKGASARKWASFPTEGDAILALESLVSRPEYDDWQVGDK